jgi:hypothetical protein
MKILVSGMVAGDPHQGGATWAILQWVLGLQRLGHDVALVEPLEEPASSAVASYFADVVARFGLEGHAVFGASDALGSFASDADVLFNVSGVLRDDELVESIPCRVYVDLDPAFTQLWHSDGIDMGFDRHTHFVTVGLGIGGASTMPTCDRAWTATLPPVVLEHWPVRTDIESDALTTVGNWRSYGPIEHEGVRYGQKAHSVRKLIKLPQHTELPVVLAMDVHPDERDDHQLLREHGWTVVDPRRVTGTPDAYRDFVSRSRAELGIAKEGYVESQSGWFSDRSACYLASGRPVIAQDTGFTRVLPTGDGLFAFSDVGDVLEAINDLRADYDHHARAARELAEEHLDSDRVLSTVLEEVAACLRLLRSRFCFATTSVRACASARGCARRTPRAPPSTIWSSKPRTGTSCS